MRKQKPPPPKIGDRYVRPTPPAAPTEAMPGTLEKQQVMQKRADQWQSLFHPADALDLSREAELERQQATA